MPEPLDVLLPFYGPPDLMLLAVDSVLSQTDEDWRLHVVDDCYPDLSVRDHLLDLGDPRITYQRNAANRGANETYRRALDLASADHVVFLGADDVLLPNYISVVRRVLADHPGAGVVQPGVEVIDEHGESASPLVDRVKKRLRPGGRTTLVGEHLAASLLRGNWTYFPSLTWDRRLIVELGFRSYGVVQDLGLLVDVAVAGRAMVVDPEIVFHYRRHGASDSSRRAVAGDRFVEEREYFATIGNELAARGWNRASRAARARLLSRGNALSNLVPAARARDLRGAAALVRHALGW